jgi:hypothetical protein
MRWARLGIVGASVLLALHVVVLAGVDLGHLHPLATATILDHQPAHQAPGVARPTRGPSMTVACLAMLAGLLLATSTVTWRRRQPLAVAPPAAAVPTPPTPPPITLGVCRS